MSHQETLTQQTYTYLKNAIYNCKYLPGQEISEKQLNEELPFGRTPIRETLLRLQNEELVEIFPRRGMRIAPFSEELVSNLYQTRKLIEPSIAATYCPVYSKKKLLAYQKGLCVEQPQDNAAYYALDIEFHAYLVSAANNRRLTAIFNDLMWHQYRLAIYAAMEGKTHRDNNDGEHLRILRALISEDRDQIKASIIGHINSSMIALMQAIQ